MQGYETQVLEGATELLAMDVPFVCELTPEDLSRCGGYDRFFEIAEQSFSWFVDMSRPGSQSPIGELRACAEAVPPGGHADVFLTKRRFATEKCTGKGGGESGIRTHGELAPTAVFKTAALNHSAISPQAAARYRERQGARKLVLTIILPSFVSAPTGRPVQRLRNSA